MLDADTFTSPESVRDRAPRGGRAPCRPPSTRWTAGETGVRARASAGAPRRSATARWASACFNNVAVAAAAARARGLTRVAIVDIDVHHGNGTQWMFYDDPSVLYVSTHQFPFYPGTGAADEIGTGDGRGFTVNVPLEAGATDADYAAPTKLVVPVLDQFAPELRSCSAGYDAHEHGSAGVDADDDRRLRGRSSRPTLRPPSTPSAPLALVTEGGYDLDALRGVPGGDGRAILAAPRYPDPATCPQTATPRSAARHLRPRSLPTAALAVQRPF